MLVGELIDKLKELPPSALVYIEADHGQQPETAHNITVTAEDHDKFPYYGDNITWSGKIDSKKATAILIS